ncbi:3-keto-disaccharide hydrolase [Oleiharenicola lentus]|uniref:3-keto-disaccharide hydrolase n=1 Tax=Oleiharenicola lentus TaxID=2508720 RepID=UPI003F66787A
MVKSIACWVIAVGTFTLSATAQQPLTVNAFERSQGWEALFDGESLKGWRTYAGNGTPTNWSVIDGALAATLGEALSTIDEHRDFEFSFEWKYEAGGVARIFLHAVEEKNGPVGKGLMMELGGNGRVSGGNGGLDQTQRVVNAAPGTWHTARVVSFGYKIEHYIDGELVLSYMVKLDDKKSRDGDVKLFGLPLAGVIVLDGNQASFRNLKIKEL